MPLAIKPAGARTYFVTMQAKTDATAGSNFPVENWTALRQEWMSRDTAMSWDGQGEQFKSGQLSGRAYDIWQGCYSADVDPELVDVLGKRRIVFQSRVFDIIQAYVLGHTQVVYVTLSKAS